MKITIALSPVGFVPFSWWPIRLYALWAEIMSFLQSIGTWLYPLSVLGGQQIVYGLLSCSVWRPSLSVYIICLWGKLDAPWRSCCWRDLLWMRRDRSLWLSSSASSLSHGATLCCLHTISRAMPRGIEYKLFIQFPVHWYTLSRWISSLPSQSLLALSCTQILVLAFDLGESKLKPSLR